MEPDRNKTNPPQPGRPSMQRRGIPFPTVEPVLTYILLGTITLIFFYAESLGSGIERSQFEFNWLKINEAIYDGEYYRLFTSMFLHANLVHWGFNSFALYVFGRDVERLFGHVRFAIIYFMGGLAGSVGSLLYTDAPSLGASGAIFAIFSAMAVYIYIHRDIYGESAYQHLRQLLFLAVFNIGFGFIPGSRIDNAAHIGGLLGGFILAWFISPEYQLQRAPGQRIALVDTNTTEKWAIVPVLFAAGLFASVAFAVSIA